MPNWCFTQMIFHGEQEEIKDFHSKIKEWTSKNYQENGFGVNWLGNILHGAGLGHRIDSETDGLRCRGDITYLGDVETFEGSNEALIYLDTETAWAPMCTMWTEVINTLNYKSIGFSYCAEEPGCEVYEVCDQYGDFDELYYYVDIYAEGEDVLNKGLMHIYDTRYYSDDGLRFDLQSLLKTDECNLETLIGQAEKFEFKDNESYLLIHKYRHIDTPTG